MKKTSSDNDPIETREWLESLASLVKHEGKERAQFILTKLLEEAEKQGVESGFRQVRHTLLQYHIRSKSSLLILVI